MKLDFYIVISNHQISQWVSDKIIETFICLIMVSLDNMLHKLVKESSTIWWFIIMIIYIFIDHFFRCHIFTPEKYVNLVPWQVFVAQYVMHLWTLMTIVKWDVTMIFGHYSICLSSFYKVRLSKWPLDRNSRSEVNHEMFRTITLEED